jgi:uroporphyrinogen decarboxylase
MKKDEMTGRERMETTLAHRNPDRVAVFPNNYYETSRTCGMTIREYASSGKTISKAVISGYRYFGYDAIQTGSDVAIEGEACGSKVEHPLDSPAFVKIPAVLDYSDFDKLEVPNPYKTGRMHRIIEATERCKDAIGKEVFIGANAMGPFNLAAQIRGVQSLLIDTLIAPEFFTRILDFAVLVAVEYSKALIDAGADMITYGEAICSPQMISPELYRTIVLPRQQYLISTMKGYGMKWSLIHICGNIYPILKDLAKTGADCVDIDCKVDMMDAKTETGLSVRGNLDTSEIMLLGTVEDVEREAKKIIETTRDGGGLILGTGCCCAPDTPFENISALVNASKKYGWYN